MFAGQEVGKALAEIQVRGLYKRTHATFEAYCRDRWGFSRPSAYEYIHAAEVADNLSAQADKAQPSFTQAREMRVLTPAQQQSVASRVNFISHTRAPTSQSLRLKRHHAAALPHQRDYGG